MHLLFHSTMQQFLLYIVWKHRLQYANICIHLLYHICGVTNDDTASRSPDTSILGYTRKRFLRMYLQRREYGRIAVTLARHTYLLGRDLMKITTITGATMLMSQAHISQNTGPLPSRRLPHYIKVGILGWTVLKHTSKK